MWVLGSERVLYHGLGQWPIEVRDGFMKHMAPLSDERNFYFVDCICYMPPCPPSPLYQKVIDYVIFLYSPNPPRTYLHPLYTPNMDFGIYEFYKALFMILCWRARFM